MRPADPQAQRRDRAWVPAGRRQLEVAELARPLQVARDDVARAEPLGALEQADAALLLETVDEPALRFPRPARGPARRRRRPARPSRGHRGRSARRARTGRAVPAARRRAPSRRQPGQRRGGAQVDGMPDVVRARSWPGRPGPRSSRPGAAPGRPRVPTAGRSPARRGRAPRPRRTAGARGPRRTEPGTCALHVHAVPAPAGGRALARLADPVADRRRRLAADRRP